MKAVLCPVCNGTGVCFNYSGFDATGMNVLTTVCHGCGGKGWVEISETDKEPR